MFDTLFGAEVPAALKFFLAFVVVLALIGATAWLVRRFGSERFGGSATRGRQPRLAVVDAAAIDGRRRLVIIRRDNVEHLLMIGGPSDVVVESNIVRAMGAPRDREVPPPRTTAASDTLSRPVPLGEGTMWPLQPQPDANHRTPRPAASIDESAQWTWQPQAEPPPRPSRPETLAGGEEFSARPAPLRESGISTARAAPVTPAAPASRPTATPPVPPAEPVSAAAGADQNLAEMAHRLEAALRRPNELRSTSEPQAKAEASPPRAAAPEQKPALTEAKPVQPKSLYDSLEQEMASLLGRPPGKP